MLRQLYIKNFLFLQEIDLDFTDGLSVFTGETGAGKSIILEALSICLGDRLEQSYIRADENLLEIVAVFDLKYYPEVKNYLDENSLFDDESLCYLRRTLKRGQPSKCYINGRPVNVSQVKKVGEMIIEIHGQGEHQKLLQTTYQKALLDQYANSTTLALCVSDIARDYIEINEKIESILKSQKQNKERLEMLEHQVNEFRDINLTKEEILSIEQEHTGLTHLQDNLTTLSQINELLNENERNENNANANSLIKQSIKLSSEIKGFNDSKIALDDFLSKANAYLSEASFLIKDMADSLDVDSGRLNKVEYKMSKLHFLARKHHVNIEELPVIHDELFEELNSISNIDQVIDDLVEKKQTLEKNYLAKVSELSKIRKDNAKELSSSINKKLKDLQMGGIYFSIELKTLPQGISIGGGEAVEFCIEHISQPPVKLKKAASGGELSRISLAIQVVLANKTNLGVLIFDEVDVGISGAVTDIVGEFLLELSNKSQIICITHQAQIAAKAHQHFRVEKNIDSSNIKTNIVLLTEKQREQEVSRMIGGIEIDEATKKHAQSMLKKKSKIKRVQKKLDI